ncbi:flagellar hook-associated protein FlgL [Thioalkalivibrio versutus]|uniref:flagellar hook-associated protein FlgL n=1 Tax=Thioalkalivibrio versutus TaxID=106634 RepID=UPI0003828423|nr:flagellar hook-associated protein FlgL [Thioalkalivibrio versutus]OOC51137.1 flagellar hook-associated protein 3 [Thioalkalivibrio versutus]
MRISTTQIFQTGIDQIQRGQTELNRTSLQMGRGERILSPSDDPSGATQVNQFERIIQATKQYQRNIDNTQPRLQQEESALQSGTDLLQRARELVVAGNNDSQTNETRSYLAGELRQLREGMFDIANTKDPNGEYLFAGTKSLQQPFQQDGTGEVRYKGAEGTGSVREVAISANRKIPVGDTGARVFMDIPENDGRVGAEVANRGAGSRLVVEQTGVANQSSLTTDEYMIRFEENDDGSFSYGVYQVGEDGEIPFDEGERVSLLDGDGPVAGDYVPGAAIEFAGRSVTVSGTPATNDQVLSRPAQNKSVFETLDAIIAALEEGGASGTSRANLATASNTALADLDTVLGNFSDIRAEVGSRLKTFDQQKDLNEDRLVDLNSAVSEIRDLDYAEAISRFNQQQVALQAAQQTYTQVNRLSLFDFL